jgi:hypothetical protein
VTTVHFINLANGVDIIPHLEVKSGESLSFLRVQSTHCEQKLWDELLLGLGPTFLTYLALAPCGRA